MKKIIFSILFSTLFLTGYSQKPCHEYTLNEQEKVIVSSYIMTCVHGHWFVNNKGVVKITRFVNEKGEKCWYLVAVIDDRYKDNPPTEYAWCNADLVFFYESVNYNSSPGSYSEKKTTPTPELLACLEEVTYDKLYIRPPVKRQYTTIFGKQILNRRLCLGNCANDQIVTFHERGDYTKNIVP
ncbi:hypothetical protein P1X15_05015 [Runella sp. MFBS21]|uniref:hypothetical protein n=1 Tax=Runella sp. MFBS21 TaxID=3034018 RepID=UPI0023FA0537|nr:hypothetical protein [Runella sp. MFBS21]MDF7816941.1 hypothetical protein [Runella sp. MFBS21]